MSEGDKKEMSTWDLKQTPHQTSQTYTSQGYVHLYFYNKELQFGHHSPRLPLVMVQIGWL